MTVTTPVIDARGQQRVVEQVRDLVLKNCPEWEDAAALASDKQADALVRIFASMMELVIQRLNKMPDKNFLKFLDMIGVNLSPPRVARAPLTFAMAKGASKYGFVPAGTQVAAAVADQKEPAVFETLKSLTVILPKLDRAVSLDPKEDRWTDHSKTFFGNKTDGHAEALFSGSNLTPHRLYLGHNKLFSFKESGELTLQVQLKEDVVNQVWEMKWYRFAEKAEGPILLSATGRDKDGKVSSDVVNLLKSGSITFPSISGIAERTLSGVEKDTSAGKTWTSRWIYAELSSPIARQQLPEIDTVKASVSIKRTSPVAPDLAFFNNIPIDLTKDCYPFGERPRFNDTFYIASREIFSKTGAAISIQCSLSDVEAVSKPDTTKVKLSWEFWDGGTWGLIGETGQSGVSVAQGTYAFLDATNAFTQTGIQSIKFTCPKIMPRIINSQENYWVRVRLAAGDYGKDAAYEEVTQTNTAGQTTKTWVYKASTLKPPSLSSLAGAYSFAAPYEYPETVIADNDFSFEEHTGANNAAGRVYRPFLPVSDTDPALYLGFDQDIATLPLTLFFPLQERTFAIDVSLAFEATGPAPGDTHMRLKAVTELEVGDTVELSNASGEKEQRKITNIDRSTRIIFWETGLLRNYRDIGSAVTFVDTPPVLAWEYWSGGKWSSLNVEDGTANLSRREMVQFPVPGDIMGRACFGDSKYWVRARLAQGRYAVPPKAGALHTNTVWAHNLATVRGEVLGSSNGLPDQAFAFSRKPVLPGQIIMVREPALTGEDRKAILAEEGSDAIEEQRDTAGNIIETWVRWHEVNIFSFSKPNSRHYVIDRSRGAITFGGGDRGLIPLAGKNNIKCAQYQYGGGAKGNVDAAAITKLRTTIPFIASVTNPSAADGGGDEEGLDRVQERGPQTLKHRDRAVTWEDFEWLVREASPKVAKVRCLPTRDPSLRFRPGWITIIVVPETSDPMPLPSQELLREIEDHLYVRTSSHLVMGAPRVNLVGPGYVRVGVEAEVKFTSLSEAKIIEARVIDNLKRFFHPLRGGPEGQGWEFGRGVYSSEVYQVIENTDGVDYVQRLSLKASVQIYTLTLERGIDTTTPYPRGSSVRTPDDAVVVSLAGELPEGSGITQITITGFKEGDQVTLSSRDGAHSVDLVVRSVDGATITCEPMKDDRIEDAYPEGGTVETEDKRTRSYTFTAVPAQSRTCALTVAVFKPGDRFLVMHRDKAQSTDIAKIARISDDPQFISLEDNYLVYSCMHVIFPCGNEKS